MTFSLNEIHAFEALEKSIGKLDMDVMAVSADRAEIYVKHARDYAANALYYYSAHQLATSLDLKERQEIVLNERRRIDREKAQAWAKEKRESHVLSLLSGLIPKANKVGTAYMETNEESFLFRITKDGQCLVEIEYDRETFEAFAEITHNDLDAEDWSALNGSSSPMQQSHVYSSVVEFLTPKVENA